MLAYSEFDGMEWFKVIRDHSCHSKRYHSIAWFTCDFLQACYAPIAIYLSKAFDS